MMSSRLAALAGTACLAAALGGCGATQADQVRAEVQQLAQATAHRDYHALCDQILAPSLIVHLTRNGIACPDAMRVALSSVRDPVASVGQVTIRGPRATAITLTSARGQRATLVAIQLVRTGRGWRIASLGSPLSARQRR